jgi:hypothetical protein
MKPLNRETVFHENHANHKSTAKMSASNELWTKCCLRSPKYHINRHSSRNKKKRDLKFISPSTVILQTQATSGELINYSRTSQLWQAIGRGKSNRELCSPSCLCNRNLSKQLKPPKPFGNLQETKVHLSNTPAEHHHQFRNNIDARCMVISNKSKWTV